MLRATASTLAKRTISGSAGARLAPSSAAFHYSARREEEAKETSSEVAANDGFMGSGLSHLYAIPVGIAVAVPILEFQWFKPDAETLLASCFVGFCVVAYTQGGDMISKSFKGEADAMLQLQNDAEDEVIAKLEENLSYMSLTENIVEDYQDAYDLTEQSYEKLRAVGALKPQHDLKAQMEKCLSMIAHEERNAYDKRKTALMAEATIAVTEKFGSDKALKKASLDAVLSKLSGKSKEGADPVQAEFVKFFQEKAAAAKKADDGSEEKAVRLAMVQKMNSTADNENWFFRLDGETGQPKMVV